MITTKTGLAVMLKFTLHLVCTLTLVAATCTMAAAVQPDSDQTTEPDEALVAASAAAEESARLRSANLQALQEKVDGITGERGPYDASLIEFLFDLGRLYQEEGMHSEALDSLSQALQVVRVTDGLYSDRQLVLLERLIMSNLAEQNWQVVDDNHHLLFQLRKRQHNTGSAEYANAVIELGEWRLRALGDNLLERSRSNQVRSLEEIAELYTNALHSQSGRGLIAEDSTGQSGADTGEADVAGRGPLPKDTLALLYGKARTEHIMARYLLQVPPDFFPGRGSRYLVRTVCYPTASPAVRPVSLSLDETPMPTLAQAAEPGAGGGTTRVCTSERIENPAYRESQRDEQRMQLNRASMKLRESIQQMQEIMLRDASMITEDRQLVQSRVVALEEAHQNLVREIRRNTFGWGLRR